MTEQRSSTSNEKDLATSELMTLPSKKLMEQVLRKNENLARIANDERHVQILIFRMLCENIDAIRKFNRSSTLLSCAILVLVIVQVVSELR